MNKIEMVDGYLYFDNGKFDEWCVYYVSSDGSKYAPKDIDYFNDLYKYTKIFDSNDIYSDFVMIYNITSKVIDENVIKLIRKVSIKYGEFSEDVFRMFATIYMGMIAEENKKNTRLGKRIKRLGVYYLLVKLETPKYCSDFMKGKSWLEIDKLCQEGGF